MEMNNQTIKTPDLGLASLFRYLGYAPIAIENNFGKVYFEFPLNPDTGKILDEFELGLRLEVEPFRLFEVLKETKGLAIRRRENDGRCRF